MPTNGKQKGARAEREVCAMLHTWWTQYESHVAPDEEVTFKRTPGSGGWAHGKGRQAFGTSADIVTNSKTFPFAVECKHRQGWSYANFLKGGRSPVWGWWDQAVRQGEEVKKLPMLWFRANRMHWKVLLPLRCEFYAKPLHIFEGGHECVLFDADTLVLTPPYSIVRYERDREKWSGEKA